MSCCGNKRKNWQAAPAQAVSGMVTNGPSKKMWPDPVVEYSGETELVVTGTITGKRYRFSERGQKLVVDYRDAAAMMAIPFLNKSFDKD